MYTGEKGKRLWVWTKGVGKCFLFYSFQVPSVKYESLKQSPSCFAAEM